MEPADPLLTATEVARELRVQPRTVRDWLKSGRLKGFTIGTRKAWRVRTSELRRFREERGDR